MPQLRFRNFADLAFVQSVDKPHYLSQLLARHADYFSRHGVDIRALTNDDDCARMLVEVFTRPDDSMPGDLLHALYVLDEVADEAGVERIHDEAGKLNIDLSGLPDNLCPGDFAIAIHLAHPELIRVCHEKTVCQKVKRYYEYRSRDGRRLDLATVKANITAIQNALAPWFDARKRTRTCRVFAYEQDDEIRILVTHGALFRSDPSITGTLELSRIGWWPQKHDSVIYGRRTGILKVHAQYPAERTAYREVFGRILFGDDAYFPESASYNLEALRTNGGQLVLVEGMKAAHLTEVVVDIDSAECRQAIWKGEDMTSTVAGHGVLPFPPGELVVACFGIEYASGGRARKLEVRLPNVADHDRERDGPIVESFLRANGFLAVGSDGIPAEQAVAAA